MLESGIGAGKDRQTERRDERESRKPFSVINT